jgi:hypothetical protein
VVCEAILENGTMSLMDLFEITDAALYVVCDFDVQDAMAVNLPYNRFPLKLPSSRSPDGLQPTMTIAEALSATQENVENLKLLNDPNNVVKSGILTLKELFHLSKHAREAIKHSEVRDALEAKKIEVSKFQKTDQIDLKALNTENYPYDGVHVNVPKYIESLNKRHRDSQHVDGEQSCQLF